VKTLVQECCEKSVLFFFLIISFIYIYIYIYLVILEIQKEFEFEFWCLMPLSAISWRPVLVVEEAGVPEEKHRPWASNC
jgi:hypothetical protein